MTSYERIHGYFVLTHMNMHIHAEQILAELTRAAYCPLFMLSCCPLHVLSFFVYLLVNYWAGLYRAERRSSYLAHRMLHLTYYHVAYSHINNDFPDSPTARRVFCPELTRNIRVPNHHRPQILSFP